MDIKDGAESSKSSGGGGGGSSSGSKNNKGTERNKKGKLDAGVNNNETEGGMSSANNATKTVSSNSAEEAKPVFRVSNPNVSPTLSKKGSPNEEEANASRKLSNSSKAKDPKFKDRKKSIGPPPPPPAPTIDNVTDDPGDSEQSESLEQDGMSLIGDIGLPMETQSMEELQSNAASTREAALVIEKSQGTLLKDKWRQISSEIRKWFDDPCRVYKLRGYHSEPNLSLPFYEKFDAKLDTFKPGAGKLTTIREKFVSCEDIIFPTGKEHPNLVRGILSEIKLRTYAIDEKMKDAWRELVELEKKRFSFLDELFAMGYVVDSLEVLSPPPKGEDGKPITQGEYFIEADEKHYRKKVDYGRVVFKTKHVYTGNFQDWYFHGPGRYSWQDGTVYQGEFCQGLMHGPGSIHWPDGCVYEGHFINGIRTGWGVYSSADGYTYAGEWLNGLPHGHGKMWYDPEDNDNDYYEGQWQQGLPEGAGTRQYSTGDRYVGNWSRGMRNGYGIMIWLQERQVYKGEWLDGVPHGLGKHLWYLERSATNSFPTRHVYQGNWVLGRREGIGKMIYPCGSVYEGRWKNGQRNGKGIFINPAGDILVGLFRAGSILGGSEVPLHAPTYDCDYSRLIEWLTAKFNLKPEENKFVMKDEDMLGELTKQYLPYIRKLYHRAGEYCQKYGNNGLYPAYLKKGQAGNKHSNLHTNSNPEDPHVHRDYSKVEETEHMRGKVEKPESLDGVNPVTRFGIWLLIRDCSQLLDEVTMAYYDKIWCETPPMSFQTRHNPFEPVYLWQFLQCLIVTSVAYYVDIPRNRRQEVVSESTEVEAEAVSEETMKSGTTPAEKRRAMIAVHRRAVLQTYVSSQFIIQNKKVGHNKKPRKNSNFTVVTGVDEKKHHSKKHLAPDPETATNKPEKDVRKQSTAGDTKNKPPLSPQNQEGQAKAPETQQKPKSTKAKRKSNGRNSVAASEMPSEMPPKLPPIIPRLSVAPVSETEEEFSSTELDLLEVEDDLLGRLSARKSVIFRNSEMMAEEELQNVPVHEATSAISVSECFELFLTEKLLPCLRREPGANLPPVPQPLPALVDLYDAFKAIKTRDVLRGTEFLRSALPHLLFPNPMDSIWWHRSPEALSHSVDLDDLMYLLREKFADAKDEPQDEVNWEEQLESEYLGAQAQNSETVMRILNLCKEDPNSEECAAARAEGSNVKRMSIALPKNILTELKKEDKGNDGDDEDPTDISDFAAEGHPFAENELVPEPFLWADDYKCVPVPRNYEHFHNISTTDVFEVLRQLYPKLCSGAHERDLHFDLIFCDWLWCTSLLAKVSTEREFRNAWKVKSTETKPIMNPQTLGVYAHYIKQIKNNPYLSPNPPPNFTPIRKAPEVDNRGSVIKSTTSFKKLK